MAITRPYRRNWSAFTRLDYDPARGKSSAMASGDAGYASRALQFNRELYRPTDTLPGATPVPSSYMPTPTTRYAGGGMSGDATSIARRYSGSSAAFATNTQNIANQRQAGYGVTAPTTGGYTGDTGTYGPPAPPPESAQPPPPPPPARMPGTVPPPGNAAQRWAGGDDTAEEKRRFMERGGSERTYNRARVAQGIRPAIDARARPANSNSSASQEIRRGFGWDKDTELPY